MALDSQQSSQQHVPNRQRQHHSHHQSQLHQHQHHHHHHHHHHQGQRPSVNRHDTGKSSLAPSILSSSYVNGDADDEHTPSERPLNGSSTTSFFADMSSPRYLGEDVRPTSRRELAAWYSYGWASEVFVVCGVGSFIPIVLEQLARDKGYLLSDPSKPCTALDNAPAPPSFNTTLASRADADQSSQCIVNIVGLHVNTASFAMYTFSLSVLLQAIVVITMSGVADHGAYRKTLLLTFATIGAVATMLFLPLTPALFLVASLLAIIANTCFGASFVLLNSFLPLLVRHHPSVTALEYPPLEEEQEENEETSTSNDNSNLPDSTTNLLQHDLDQSHEQPSSKSPKPTPVQLQLMTRLSSTGIGLGYLAAIIVQIASVLIVVNGTNTLLSLKLALFTIGAWWLLFTIPSAVWLRPRPGPPLGAALPDASPQQRRHIWRIYLAHSWRSLGRTVVRARRLKDMMLFLAAWFLLSDGVATISGTAVLFAKTTLHMDAGALAMINVVVMFFGVIGAFSWSFLSRSLGLVPSRTILVCVALFELIPLYALLGYLPIPIGLKAPWEMYVLGAVYGIVLGGVSSYCRAVFGDLIPPGSEAAFYALYAITDKGSSVFGPAIVGLITDAAGEIRPAFWFLAVLIALPIPLLALVDPDRGRRQALALAQELAAKEGIENFVPAEEIASRSHL